MALSRYSHQIFHASSYLHLVYMPDLYAQNVECHFSSLKLKYVIQETRKNLVKMKIITTVEYEIC